MKERLFSLFRFVVSASMVGVMLMSSIRCGGMDAVEDNDEVKVVALSKIAKISIGELRNNYSEMGPVTVILPGSALEKQKLSFSSTYDPNCDREHTACYRRCVSKIPTWKYLPEDFEEQKAICSTRCLAEFMACVKATEQAAVFATLGAALLWVENNYKEILVGTVIVIGVTVLIVATDGLVVPLIPYMVQTL